ncbi:MAG: methylmalonyl Co-A mutase-associated GTPase MeaB [Spirochaetia bacterium]|jgi:LAO/AO transport system kinase|nr:methylmalonyl Co-A mutase-associated GTPase MeaB [Spirochaetia bacterium]
MYEDLARRCLDGEVRAVARFISLLEDGNRQAYDAMSAFASTMGRAQTVGITGPPGSGKSTLTDKLIGYFRSQGKKVAVIAVDPSSPFSGGAILGDRLRMQGHAVDPGVYIRSLASRGQLGGLSKATAFALRVLEAAGYDLLIIETVGVGQSEIDIVKVADTVVLVSVPGLGDDIQVIKAGIMEIGDIFVVNKSDRDGADRVVREIRAMLETQAALKRGRSPSAGPDTLASRSAELLHHGQVGAAAPQQTEEIEPEDLPPVMKTIAETGEGVPELGALILTRYENDRQSGALENRRLGSIRAQLRDIAAWQLMDRLADSGANGRLDSLAESVQARNKDIYGAAKELTDALIKGESI